VTYTQPLFPLILVALIVAAWRSDRPWSRLLLRLAVAVLVLISWPPTACLMLLPFEGPYSHSPPAGSGVQAIVVLSSAVYPPNPPLPTSLLGGDTVERTNYAAWLQKQWSPVPVLASGKGLNGDSPYSKTMAEELQKQGVPADRIWTETESRSTYQNAAYSAALLRAKGIHRIAVVTEAYHMRRAEACFRKQGFDVVPAPCVFRIPVHFRAALRFPGWEAICWSEDVLHEAVALAWYWVTGKI
jgi:uncharacterized SAM-binding protein YcdF (DUF218 family)